MDNLFCCAQLYNHSRPWVSHVSLQGLEDRTAELRARYRKPFIWDEVQYEGNIPNAWGALTGAEEADRFWWGAALGVHVGHSETILRQGVTDDAQPLWWAKGGKLVGASAARIRWFRQVWSEALSVSSGLPSFGELTPSQRAFAPESGAQHGPAASVLSDPAGHFQYLHFLRTGSWIVPLPADANGSAWRVTWLDYWRMTREEGALLTASSTNVTIEIATLPANVFIQRMP